MVVTKDNPGKSHWSLVMLQRTIGANMMVNHVMLRMDMMRCMMMTSMVVLIICIQIVIIRLLRCLPLGVFFILHPPILKPDLNLPFG